MTRDELIEKVARAIYVADDMDETYEEMETFFKCLATSAIDTIFTALKEPTDEMEKSAIDAAEDDCLWQAMLNASPLAPNNKENNK